MADTKKDENQKIIGIKDLAIFLASGAFAKLHRKFLVPTSESYWGDQVVNWLHHFLHSLIGIAIQIVLFLWVLKFIIAAVREIKDRGK